MSVGRSGFVAATLSRTFISANFTSVPRVNETFIIVMPSLQEVVTLSSPSSVEKASSRGFATIVSISSADAPGYTMDTETVGKSTFGIRSHGRLE